MDLKPFKLPTEFVTSPIVNLVGAIDGHGYRYANPWQTASDIVKERAIKTLVHTHSESAALDAKLWQALPNACKSGRLHLPLLLPELCKPVAPLYVHYSEEDARKVIDWLSTVANRWSHVYTEGQVEAAAYAINEAALQREVSSSGARVAMGAISADAHAVFVEEAARELGRPIVNVRAATAHQSELIANRKAGKRTVSTYVSTGFTALDIAIRGFKLGDLILATAGTGIGKTQFLAAFVRNVLWTGSARAASHTDSSADERAAKVWQAQRLSTASMADVKVLCLLGSDMTADDFIDRIEDDLLGFTNDTCDEYRQTVRENAIINRCDIYDRLAGDQFRVWDSRALSQALGRRVDGLDITVVEQAITTWARTVRAAAAREGKSVHPVAVIDYLQQVTVDPKVAKAEGQIPNDTWRLAYVAKRLRVLASELGVAIVAAAQLNGRAGHQSSEANSLRGSAGPEHEASLLLSLDALSRIDRKLAHGLVDDATLALAQSVLRIKVVKGRNIGHIDDVYLTARLAYGCRVLDMNGSDAARLAEIGDVLDIVRAQVKAATAPSVAKKKAKNTKANEGDFDVTNIEGLA